jgi:hypothetical protein
LIVPELELGSKGQSYHQFEKKYDFEAVFVANENSTVETINAKLAAGLQLVLQPGQYNLTGPIMVTKANTTILGIGFATLINTGTDPAIIVGDVEGVRIGGILFQAGSMNSTSLVQWGTNSSYAGNAANPGLAFDLFTRVGGDNDPTVQNMTT